VAPFRRLSHRHQLHGIVAVTELCSAMGLLLPATRRDISDMTSSIMPAQQQRERRRTIVTGLGLAALLLLSLSRPAFAQDTGTSGIPPGPANANGPIGSVRDPSGIGNAARMPPLPQQLGVQPVPSGVPFTSTQPAYTPRVRYRAWRHLPKRQREKLERAEVKENERLLRRGAVSICRGC
jgi:hypothetical protein